MSNSQHYHLMQNKVEEEVFEGALQNTASTSSLGSHAPFLLNTNTPSEIYHVPQLVVQIGQLFMNETGSDLTLIVEGISFPAHKVILTARSSYFSAMLNAGMRESSQREITLHDTPVQAFKILLKYIYFGRIKLSALSYMELIDVLGLVNKYAFSELEAPIIEYLKTILNIENVCLIYTTAQLYSTEVLITACLDFIDNYAMEILSTQGFLQLSELAIRQLIERNSFCAPEIEIFKAVLNWIEAHPEAKDSFRSILDNVRLSLIKLEDLLNVVRPSNLFEPEKILDAINDQSNKKKSELIYRGFLLPNVNVATEKYNAKVLVGESPSGLLMLSQRGRGGGHDSEGGSTRHFINPPINSLEHGIVVELGRCFIINNIQLHLLDREQRMFSYYVEVSIDRNDWVRVIDYRDYLCRCRQNLFFQERVVKFIKIVGTHASLHGIFNLVSFEALYNTEPVEVDPKTTLLIPKENVATIPNNALVIEGVSRSRNALLNGNTEDYNWDDGYTCHQLGSGAITIQLPQPYLIDSMRLRLWDCDDRNYSFYVEVSCDQNQWTKIIDVSTRKSWQIFQFERIAMVFIKIVGTYNSANEVFHCVHFECPSQIAIDSMEKRPQLIMDGPSTSANSMPNTNNDSNGNDGEVIKREDSDERLSREMSNGSTDPMENRNFDEEGVLEEPPEENNKGEAAPKISHLNNDVLETNSEE